MLLSLSLYVDFLFFCFFYVAVSSFSVPWPTG